MAHEWGYVDPGNWAENKGQTDVWDTLAPLNSRKSELSAQERALAFAIVALNNKVNQLVTKVNNLELTKQDKPLSGGSKRGSKRGSKKGK